MKDVIGFDGWIVHSNHSLDKSLNNCSKTSDLIVLEVVKIILTFLITENYSLTQYYIVSHIFVNT